MPQIHYTRGANWLWKEPCSYRTSTTALLINADSDFSQLEADYGRIETDLMRYIAHQITDKENEQLCYFIDHKSSSAKNQFSDTPKYI